LAKKHQILLKQLFPRSFCGCITAFLSFPNESQLQTSFLVAKQFLIHLEYFLEYSVKLERITEQSDVHIMGTLLSPNCGVITSNLTIILLHKKITMRRTQHTQPARLHNSTKPCVFVELKGKIALLIKFIPSNNYTV